MAAMNNSVHIPVRSISLPSRLHPNSLKIETELTKLKSASTSNFSGVESLQIGLTSLADLFICIDELTHSPQTQQSFHHLNQVEVVLDGSIGLIDVCSNARDLFLTMQEHIQDLQSALRRRCKDFSSIESNIQAYISFRNRTKKEIANSIRTLKRLERNYTVSFSMYSEVNQLSYLIKVIKEAHAIAISVFQSVLLFLSSPIMKTNKSGWSLISKRLRSGFLASDKDQKIFNEVGRVDIALFSIHGQIRKNDARFDVQEMQERLKTLATSIQDTEAKLDSVFRCLIQNRVSLLNLVTP